MASVCTTRLSKFTIGLAVQWNPVNTPDTKWTCSRGHAIVSVISGCPYIQRDFRKNVTDKIRLKSKQPKRKNSVTKDRDFSVKARK